MATTTLITSRDPKGRHAVQLFEAAYNKSKLDDVRAQRLNERGGELQDGIAKLIVKLTTSNQHADEEVRSGYAYPKEYRCRPIEEQIERIAKLFNLNPQHAYAFMRNLPLELPDGAEGWFAIPSIDALGGRQFVWKVKNPKERLCRATNAVLVKIGELREFYNHFNHLYVQLTPDRFHLNEWTAHALDVLAEQQKGDVWIVGGQFGERYAGKFVSVVRQVMGGAEFGAHTVAAGSMLLTHPERLVSYNDLWFDAPGDEFDPGGGGLFDNASYFTFIKRVEFSMRFVNHSGGFCGSVSLFLP